MFRRIAFFSVIACSLVCAQEQQQTFKIQPLRLVPELRAEAQAAKPPAELGPFRQPDLVELVKLDPTIKLDIHYASTNNFMGTPFYTQARAFLERPAAEALVRVNTRLHQQGYGLLIFDGYRPWYVTKMFWDGTPVEDHLYVANPAQGSKHNRGCAVDLTLYDSTTCVPANRSICPAATTRCPRAPTPTMQGERPCRTPTARCCVRPWKQRVSRSILRNGGTSITRTGGCIRS